MKTITKILVAAMALYTYPAFAQVPYTPYGTVDSTDGNGSTGRMRYEAPQVDFRQPSQYQPKRRQPRQFGSPNGTGRGAQGHDGRRYVPAGEDPNPAPEIVK